MGTCCSVKSSPSKGDLNEAELRAHEDIKDQLITAEKQDNRIKKLLLLGSGSSGKSTIFRQLKCVYDEGFSEAELCDILPALRLNCVAGILTLLRKSEQLYQLDEKEHSECYIDLASVTEDVLSSIHLVVRYREESFEEFENAFYHHQQHLDTLGNAQQHDSTEQRIEAKKHELQQLCQSIDILWRLPQLQATWTRRNSGRVAFSFPDNMHCFYNAAKLAQVFTWNYIPVSDDVIKCRVTTTGTYHALYRQENLAFTVTDVGGQRNERRKWIWSFEGVTAVIFVAALSHYATVLYEDESVNAMIESLDLFFEVCNSKWFKKTEFILFLNKQDLFRQCIANGIGLSECFNAANECIYKKEYEVDDNYYPRKKGGAKLWSTGYGVQTTLASSMKHRSYNKIGNTSTHDQMMDEMDENEVADGGGQATQATAAVDDEAEHEAWMAEHDDGGCGGGGGDGEMYAPFEIDATHDNREYRSKSATYPKPDLVFANKRSYDGGQWHNESDEKWLEYIYLDYLHFITEQYLSKNLHSQLKRVFVHVTTATDQNNIIKVFWNVQNIIIRSNLKYGGLV